MANPSAALGTGSQKSPYTASTAQIHTWAVGNIAAYWMYMQFANIMIIYTTGFKLDPRWVGLALFLPRLLDGLLDPLIGHLSDNTHTKWGRRRPFLFVTTLIGAVMVVAIWMPSTDWPQWGQFVWLTVGSVILFSTWGTYNMAYNALGYELSDDYSERSKVFAVGGLYVSIVGVFGGYYYWLAQKIGTGLSWDLKLGDWTWSLNVPSVGGEINGVRLLSVVTAVMVLACGLIPAFFVKERFANSNRKHVSLRKAFIATFQCRPFLILLVLQIVRGFGAICGGLVGYIGIYHVCHGDKLEYAGVMGFGGILGLVAGIALVPLAKPLTKSIGKRMGLIITFGITLLSAIVSIFIYRPGFMYVVMIFGFLTFFPTLIQNLFLSSLMPDICDIDELATGQRREGLFSSVKEFIAKLENSICALASMWLLAYTGFDAHLPLQPPEVIQRMFWLAFAPGILFAFLAFLVTFFIPITEEMMDDVRAKLAAARAARGDVVADV